MVDFGSELQRRRKAARLSPTEMAKRSQFSEEYLAKVENGNATPNTALGRVADDLLNAGGALAALVGTGVRDESAGGLPESSTLPLRGVPFREPLTGHTGMVLWGDVGGRPVLVTGSDDGVVRLWEVVVDRAVARLPSYRSDTAEDSDALSRAEDAVAVAELIVARTARPPLAIGLFGDWGEGKSHFLELLRREVRVTATSPRHSPRDHAPEAADTAALLRMLEPNSQS
ncbi:hypothetical protein BS329_18070 [Amycolatopsis coloradensis]|uniref:HTH cro/C1-type domain-containing protein n=1 Tax=Amycolatopsis coloradensis TaxID=76021 RepID=A0A1R0KT91_9PSEU|nr:helix-turn-helix transcriptional regulator [Amycolatopsis coloradensis]OLZ51147.1 hypothetical protein BS329_18070 [Amycolatopsis coloradensis]